MIQHIGGAEKREKCRVGFYILSTVTVLVVDNELH
jgi:hypothetical protein